MENTVEIVTWHEPPLREEWETELYLPDKTAIELPKEPGLVFIILRSSGEKGREIGQEKFIYEIQDVEGRYLGYCSIGGSGLPKSVDEAIITIENTYKKHLKHELLSD